MIDRLNRILSLSKKTGDTVVIHDSTAVRDLVVLPFDQYESLIASEREFGDYDEYLLEEMSERELIDKINRDIAIWRSYQELNERDRAAGIIEDQLRDEPLPDPFEEDFSHRSDWHHVSDLIGARHQKKNLNQEDDSLDPIQTYVPVEEPRELIPTLASTTRPTNVAPYAAPTGEETEVLGEESSLEGDDDVIFFEEPNS